MQAAACNPPRSFLNTPVADAPASPATRERAALLLAVALILVWGSNFSVQKYVFAALTPGGFLFARYLITSLLPRHRRQPLIADRVQP